MSPVSFNNMKTNGMIGIAAIVKCNYNVIVIKLKSQNNFQLNKFKDNYFLFNFSKLYTY